MNIKIEKIFITYRDRLSRLSFNLFKQLFEKFGCEIIILNDIDSQSDSKIIEKVELTFSFSGIYFILIFI